MDKYGFQYQTQILLKDHYLQRSCPGDYIRHIHHAFIIIFETRHTGLIMASLNVLVKFLPSSPFRLSPCFFIGIHRFLSASCFSLHLLNFLGYARGKDLILQPRFYRLPRVRHSIRSHTFSRSVFSVLSPFCLQYFLGCILCFGCIYFQCFPCYYFPASAPGIPVLQGGLIPCRITGRKTAIPRAATFPTYCPHSTTLSFRLQLPSFSISFPWIP